MREKSWDNRKLNSLGVLSDTNERSGMVLVVVLVLGLGTAQVVMGVRERSNLSDYSIRALVPARFQPVRPVCSAGVS